MFEAADLKTMDCYNVKQLLKPIVNGLDDSYRLPSIEKNEVARNKGRPPSP
jgi:hypothetical protein